MTDHVDVLIIGAGLSGIGAAAQLTREHPGRSYAVLERRAASGGTWDLFRYPGIRSDSDMFTLGYRFKPWRGDKALADGPSILAYVRETAARVRHRRAHPLRVRRPRGVVGQRHRDLDGHRRARRRGPREITCHFLWATTGYYDYEQGYRPEFPGEEAFAGQVIHPQHWPEDLDHTGKRVVVIGSGATAVTLVPALAESGAGHVTMLQRSPTYILSLPAEDKVAQRLRKVLPEKAGLRRHPVEERRRLDRPLPAQPAPPGDDARRHPQGRTPSCCPRATTSTPTSSRPTTRGTSGCAWCPTATCSGRSATARAEVVTDTHRDLHPDRACGWRPAASSRPTSW